MLFSNYSIEKRGEKAWGKSDIRAKIQNISMKLEVKP